MILAVSLSTTPYTIQEYNHCHHLFLSCSFPNGHCGLASNLASAGEPKYLAWWKTLLPFRKWSLVLAGGESTSRVRSIGSVVFCFQPCAMLTCTCLHHYIISHCLTDCSPSCFFSFSMQQILGEYSQCLVSVDGTDYRIREPSNAFQPKRLHASCMNGPGLRYKIAICIQIREPVWTIPLWNLLWKLAWLIWGLPEMHWWMPWIQERTIAQMIDVGPKETTSQQGVESHHAVLHESYNKHPKNCWVH
jgi:hypothetical protein